VPANRREKDTAGGEILEHLAGALKQGGAIGLFRDENLDHCVGRLVLARGFESVN
jgi:hypothetical protein